MLDQARKTLPRTRGARGRGRRRLGARRRRFEDHDDAERLVLVLVLDAFRAPDVLTGDTVDKVKAAALKKVPGGTVLRAETDDHHSSPYEAHVRKSDGTEVEVLVDKDFEATVVNELRHP